MAKKYSYPQHYKTVYISELSKTWMNMYEEKLGKKFPYTICFELGIIELMKQENIPKPNIPIIKRGVKPKKEK